MLLSRETLEGLKITGKQNYESYNSIVLVYSFVELVQYLFTVPGVSAFLSNKTNWRIFSASRGREEGFMKIQMLEIFPKILRH